MTNKSPFEQLKIVEDFLSNYSKRKEASFAIDCTAIGFYGKEFAGYKIDNTKNITRFRMTNTLILLFPITYNYFEEYKVKLAISKREIHIPECKELFMIDDTSGKVLDWIHHMPVFRNFMVSDFIFPNLDLEVEEFTLIKWSRIC
jgi:hypothetical protein